MLHMAMQLHHRTHDAETCAVTLSLRNPGSELAAFKVKTTAPKKYCVRPHGGIVKPGATADIQASGHGLT